MPQHIPYLNIFLSSPGDVPQEREIARRIMKRLPNRYGFKGRVALNIIAWDDPESGTAMEATLTPQEAINRGLPRPSECDIVIVIFWGRLGTAFTDTDGQKYESGTQWELLDALKSSKPRTYIYQRTEKPDLGDIDAPKYEDNLAQYRRLQTFLKSDVFYRDGEIKRSVHQYKTPGDFETLFELRFEEIVGRILESLSAGSFARASNPNIEVAETIDWPRGQSPFPGLRSFTKADAPIFFGREHETDELVKRVAENRFVATVGASGSGKSSLVGAGLLSRLQANAISSETTGSKDWYVVQFTPGQGDHPFAALFDGILKTFEVLRPTPFDLRRVKNQFVQDMLADPMTVCDTLLGALETAKAPAWAEVLLFIDQFEELFTLAKPESIAPFAAMLNRLSVQPRVRVIVTMRHDFVHRAIEIPELATLLNMASFNLAAPTTGALAQMIKRPAELAGLEFEDGLPEQILNDMGNAAGALALMAYTLDELYKIADSRHDRRLALVDYQSLGGVQGAIGKRAEQTFQNLSLNEKETLLGHVFRELVEVDERGTATRQRAPQGRFGEPELVLVRAFTNARLLVMDENEVEVAHEALFRSWERLKDWIAEAQEDLILLRQVRNAAHDWQAKGRPDYLLWPQERLILIYAMQERLAPELTEVERDYIEPEQARLLREVETLPKTAESHERRRDIGDRLAVIGDTRRGVGVKNGIPDVLWLSVEGSGKPIVFRNEKGNLYGQFTVQPFYIAQYQVTYAQYQAFVEAKDGFKNPARWAGMPEQVQQQALENQRTKSLNNPRDSVSWYQAVAFSRWLDAKLREIGLLPDEQLVVRLPTEWEWQWAAQAGEATRDYPWGEWQEGYADTSEAGLSRTVAVGLYAHGEATCKALDLAGNVFEWCLNDYAKPEIVDGYDNGKDKVVRGGSFYNNRYTAHASYRSQLIPHHRNDPYGFRVVLGSPIKAI